MSYCTQTSSPEYIERGRTLAQHIYARSEKTPTGCWLWSGAISSGGYGYCYDSRHGVEKAVHRVVCEVEHGAIPPGCEIDHLCRVRNCVNPEHLEAVTHSQNVLRAVPWRRRRRAKGDASMTSITSTP